MGEFSSSPFAERPCELPLSRFHQLGTLSDLEEAVALQRGAFEHRTQGHPHRALWMINLASSLLTRFEQLGTMSDFQEAVALQCSALEHHPQGHPDRAYSLSNLASSLLSRFDQLGTMSDLEEAALCPAT
ncbi:hypothetical protein EV363DRAFT_1493485 [Boletus edulis]|uniref:Uncharacterized protein n=1 Tax=Boletus edulis BED1 TaxID=1328754 RepID=A0AAD4BMZ9_BOLED|nr:hypothetical protein EV363DRAFT_1493485 [Boletus edulis]KAF8435463.1 hypothetical protein L210DRAFT_3694799 [Boletus edulis BED1]